MNKKAKNNHVVRGPNGYPMSPDGEYSPLDFINGKRTVLDASGKSWDFQIGWLSSPKKLSDPNSPWETWIGGFGWVESGNKGKNKYSSVLNDDGIQISMNESHNRNGFVPLDVGKNHGAYQMGNYKSNIKVRGNLKQITVQVTSSNTPVIDGRVVFSANASLVVNGNIIQTQSLANGIATFKLPSSQNISLTVKGGWIVRYDYGGAAVPVYHPIFWPFSLNFTDNFKLK